MTFSKMIGTICLLFVSTDLVAESYRKATEDEAVILNKLYSRSGELELEVGSFGLVLNQSYVQTFLIHGGLTWFSSEEWGFGVDVAMGLNSDKSERYCIENFYNDPKEALPSCRDEGGPDALEAHLAEEPDSRANYGPAYVPIREIGMLIAAKAVWNPIYGKQLFFGSAVGYFDVFLTMGGGLTTSTFYPKQTVLRNGKVSRDSFPDPSDTTSPVPGADISETDSYGEAGRPDPVSESHPTIVLGLGQRLHFGKMFNVKAEVRNYTLLGTDQGFDTFFTVWAGLGIRL